VILFLVSASIALGLVLSQRTANPSFTLPSFVWVLLVGVVMFAILASQIALMYLFVTQVTFRVLGRHYDAPLLSAAQCGFGLGATPTAMANMEALARRYGYSVRAFLVAPIIGAFLIGLCNAIVISAFAQALSK
jgi:ESS family glutamate:Na+ symporter